MLLNLGNSSGLLVDQVIKSLLVAGVLVREALNCLYDELNAFLTLGMLHFTVGTGRYTLNV